MSGKLEVHVTAEDIVRGIRDNCSDCPVALALKRAFPEIAKGLTVDTDSFYGDWQGEIYRLPQEAQDFILDFDLGRHVRPFSFTVSLEEAQR